MSFSQGYTDVLETARKLAMLFEALSNEIRVIILALLMKNKSMTWRDMGKALQTVLGARELNPNLLAFHLRKLVKSNLVLRRELGENIVYEIREENIPIGVIEAVKPVLEKLP